MTKAVNAEAKPTLEELLSEVRQDRDDAQKHIDAVRCAEFVEDAEDYNAIADELKLAMSRSSDFIPNACAITILDEGWHNAVKKFRADARKFLTSLSKPKKKVTQ